MSILNARAGDWKYTGGGRFHVYVCVCERVRAYMSRDLIAVTLEIYQSLVVVVLNANCY